MKPYTYQHRVSQLDDMDDHSVLSKSKLHGFYYYAHMLGIYYLIDLIYFNQLGTILANSPTISAVKRDGILMIIWAIYSFTYPYTIYFSHKFGQQKLYIFFISLPFIIFPWFTIKYQLGFIPGAFVGAMACIGFMKEVSYIKRCQKPISLWEFFIYMITPALVFYHDYPKTKKIRLVYCFAKLFNIAYFDILGAVIIAKHIEPAIIGTSDQLLQTILLLFPLTAFWIVLFFLTFENILNLLAEITYFGDREFYHDWWNATTFEEFNAKWNTVVYAFLHTHVYLQFQEWKIPRVWSKVLTFAFSALLHEVILITALRQFTPFMTFIMLLQVPVMMALRFLKNTRIGLIYFWFSLLHGVPIIVSYYVLV
ncbi:unnamed protein product [Paramecium primaurelia]|uniref:O-acyltransferase n=1 Tax=Paramecium primaurelia TaxID=5886 RepID=A0A8S1MSI8_PARPR|nr:unnamed protein product [Paramecium primaurelia]